jgi:hypothetical protein
MYLQKAKEFVLTKKKSKKICQFKNKIKENQKPKHSQFAKMYRTENSPPHPPC